MSSSEKSPEGERPAGVADVNPDGAATPPGTATKIADDDGKTPEAGTSETEVDGTVEAEVKGEAEVKAEAASEGGGAPEPVAEPEPVAVAVAVAEAASGAVPEETSKPRETSRTQEFGRVEKPDASERAEEPEKTEDTAAPVKAAAESGASGSAGSAGVAVASAESPAPTASQGSGTPNGPGGGKGGGGGGSGGGGKGPKKTRSRKVKYARRILFTLLGFIGFCVAAFGVAYLFTPVPSPQEEAVAQGPSFYYADGKTLIAKTGVNRDAVRLDQIPDGVRNGVIAAENRSFYGDPGVSFTGTARAFWSTATGEQLQGGSTITQQMVRNYYGGIGKERSVTRKLKEVMVSLKVGREKPKDWILEQYLNTIYFGRDAYGVQAAAKAYFGTDVKNLSPAQGAYLAAAIQQPSVFADPTGSRRASSEQRWHAVVGNMVRDGAVSSADAAAMKFPVPAKEKITDVLKGQKGYMVNVAKKELTERRGFSEDEINRSGLKITTTFDKRLMDSARKTVTANMPAGMSKKIRTAMVSVDPATGQVVAFYGGRNYLNEALSSAFGDAAQAGSGFKPIALAAALDSGKTLASSYDGSSPQYFRGTPIKNDSGENFGQVNLVTATQHSINTAYVNLGQDIGNEKIAEMAEKMGIPAGQMQPAQRESAVFPLGVVSLHPVQQAGVYATFAAEGEHRTPYVVKAVTDNEDNKRTFTEKATKAFSPQNARDATYAMQQVVQGGTGGAAQLPDGRDVAGKTGTTDQGRAIWFNGYIPQMATTVSMFRSDGKPLNIPGYGSYGGQLPAQTWRSFMSEAVSIKGYDQESFGSPSMTPGGGYQSPGGGTPGGPTTPRTPGLSRPPQPQRPAPGPVLPSTGGPGPGSPGGGGEEGGGTEPGGGGTEPGGGGGDGGTEPGGGGGGTTPGTGGGGTRQQLGN
ncbi:transglycosylase domain-containing protein [Actinomadura xylanilytica]|uniref:transglycosylase domain-containing protein n=1 Tax=Actinomadura xylanilytica TaxID=887459 RepID=UPI00255AF81F|nr:transglycosylase domain-containing protein [Actinomadura xylanilytica]MDL4777448.1 transglycosylase domain-containing protein [Actinomadura xylanilytica]